ncbi:hypothetical protein SDC9_171153 [bioreactor metagenome]|uniref:Uncharacterized protein n=1 Tax=bioreactor metagenome TaxID=1076179 RepID=A0A645GCF9_9ZZZZ
MNIKLIGIPAKFVLANKTNELVIDFFKKRILINKNMKFMYKIYNTNWLTIFFKVFIKEALLSCALKLAEIISLIFVCMPVEITIPLT